MTSDGHRGNRVPSRGTGEAPGVRWRTTCLVNPRAANSRWMRRPRLRTGLERRLPGEILDVKGDMRAMVQLARAASADSELLVAMGGDGTIADVLQGIYESGRQKEILFGIIPYGSGNAFRKSFGIPRNPRRAADRLVSGVPREADVMLVEGRVAGFASVGATAAVTEEKLRHPTPGAWGHLLASRKMFRFDRSEVKELELEDGIDEKGRPFHRRTVRSPFFDCVISKTNFFGYGWRVAPRARVDDGFLDVTLFELPAWQYILLFPLIYLGLLQHTQRHFKARRVVVRGRSLSVQYNGEILPRRTEAEFRVLPGGLRIICPRTRKDVWRFKRLPLKLKWPPAFLER